MQTSTNFYTNLGYYFLFLLVLMFIAFFSSYFLIIFLPTPQIVHIHFSLMFLWMLMLIAQPFLIKYKKFYLHRLLGRLSYFLVPLVLTAGFFMMRFAYARDVNKMREESAAGVNTLSNEQITHIMNEFAALPLIWFTWFLVFYSLGIINRQNSAVHARLMLSTALALLGPIVDRIIFRMDFLLPNIRLESIAFLIADVILMVLLWKDYRNGKPLKTLGIALSIYILGQLAYFTIPYTEMWQKFATLILT